MGNPVNLVKLSVPTSQNGVIPTLPPIKLNKNLPVFTPLKIFGEVSDINLEGVKPVGIKFPILELDSKKIEEHFEKFKQQKNTERKKALELFYSKDRNNNFFIFNSDGTIEVLPRITASQDLSFLEHVRTGEYKKPNTEEVTFAIYKSRVFGEQQIVSEEESFFDGVIYQNPTILSENGWKDSYPSDNEYIVIDKSKDKVLLQTINAFKERIKNNNLSEFEKMKELMKFIDEVFYLKNNNEIISDNELMQLTRNIGSLDVVLFGEILNSGAGICRHRALLAKILGDEIGLKTRLINGFISPVKNREGHVWNEIIISTDDSEQKTYLFDAMHKIIADISDTNLSYSPQITHYTLNNEKLDPKYLNVYDNNNTMGLIYRLMKCKRDIPTYAGNLIHDENGGYIIEPTESNEDLIKINGEPVHEKTKADIGDWVQIKLKFGEIGFQITK